MAGCYLCGTSLTKGHGVRRNVRTGTSVAGLFSAPPTIFLVVLAVLAGGKVPSIRSYFGLRTLCPTCGQRLDAQRSLRRKILLCVVAVMLVVAVTLTIKR
jgi:hypothetical protein